VRTLWVLFKRGIRSRAVPWIVLVGLLAGTEFMYVRAQEADTEAVSPLSALVGRVSGSFLIFGLMLIQIRARILAERLAQELNQSRAALAAERNRLAVTLTSIEDGVITTDLSGRVVSMNPAAERMTSWPEAQATGQPLEKVFRIVHARNREPRIVPVASVMRVNGVPNSEAGTLLIARNGTERFIADAASPTRGDDGQQSGMVLVFRDITEQRKAEDRQLRESKLETIGSLAGGIAHDYNNILTILVGNLSLARAHASDPPKLLERLNAVEASAQRAKELTQQLLTFARGGVPIKRPTALEPVLRESVEFALHGAKVLGEVQIANGLWNVELDESQFRHALNDVVLFGVRAMPAGGKIEIEANNCELREREVGEIKRGRYVQIMIRDQSNGLSPDKLQRIFDPYLSTKNPGANLGLATAHSIVRKHGGDLVARSTPNRGTTFEILLPASTSSTTSAPIQKQNSRAQLRGARVLIMDDEAGIREALALLLDLLGVESESVRDGHEALARYEAARAAGRPFSAVIMDLTIPNGMGGEEAVRRLKQLDDKARAIVSSGYSNDPVMGQYTRYGFDGVMPKPYHLDQLEKVLRAVLQGEEDSKRSHIEEARQEMQLSL
jgi:two-component system cell cycle sensor histidine kinase/response regulator CckA